MSLLNQWTGVTKYMLRDVDTFVDNYDEDHGIGYPIKFLAVTVFVMALVATLLMVLANLSSPADLRAAAMLGVLFLIVGFVAAIVEALLVHGIVSLLGGPNGSTTTFEAYAFPSAVRYGLSFVPLLNVILGLYGLYLQIKTLSSFQEISEGKAGVALIVAALITVPVTVAVLVLAVAVIGAFALEMGGSGGAV